MEVLPKAHLEQAHTPLMLLKNCNSSTCSSSVSGDEGTCEVLLAQKIKALDLQDKNSRTKQMESSCLLTPPNTPLSSERMESDTECPHHQRGDTTKQEEGEVERLEEMFRI